MSAGFCDERFAGASPADARVRLLGASPGVCVGPSCSSIACGACVTEELDLARFVASGELDALDTSLGATAAPRKEFLAAWVSIPGGHSVGLVRRGALVAFGAARPAAVGFKVGPIVADSPALAARVLAALLERLAGQQVEVDIPGCNAAARDLVQRCGLVNSFTCERMYLGPSAAASAIRHDHVFAVQSLEFGA